MKKTLPLLLIGGQSNAVGCTNTDTLDEKDSHGEFPDVFLYQEGNFTPEAKKKILSGIRLGMGCKPHQMGIEYGLASELNTPGAPVGFIRFAYGGTDLGFHWQTEYDLIPATVEDKGYCFHEFIGTVQRGLASYSQAGWEPSIMGMVWMQGESDANKTREQAEEYQSNLTCVFQGFRNRLSLPELKILVGGISTTTALAPYSDIVREKQKEYCQHDPLCFYLDNTDLPMGADGWHYGGNECLKLGKRFGALVRRYFFK